VIGPDPYSFRALWRHYRTCRRNKRATKNALAFEIDAEAGLLALQGELRARTYRPGPSICFLSGGPKPREVFAAGFRDRIVHHLLVAHQERVFEPRFIHDSFACRRGKGTLAASDRLMCQLRRVTANGRRAAWALKLDVASFFPSIHKETLYAILTRYIQNPELRWLTRVVLFQDPTASYRFRSRRHGVPPPGTPGYPVAAAKSLFGKENARGLPIGNLTSQFWANVYLNDLDQFVKRSLGCRHYVRYVDDMVLLANDPADLVRARDAIATFLRVHLRLALRAGPSEPFLVGRGIEFVGWKTWWDRRLARRRTVGNLSMRLDAFARAAVRSAHGGAARRIALGTARAAARVERLRATLASYSGHLRHGAAFGDWDRAWRRYGWLGALFARRGWQVAARWPPRPLARAGRFSEQYWQLVRRAGPRCLVFCQVGRYVEFRGPQRRTAERVLGLATTHFARAGYGLAVGFPGWLARRYEARALARGHAVAVVRETGERPGGCHGRRPVALLVPEGDPAMIGRAST